MKQSHNWHSLELEYLVVQWWSFHLITDCLLTRSLIFLGLSVNNTDVSSQGFYVSSIIAFISVCYYELKMTQTRITAWLFWFQTCFVIGGFLAFVVIGHDRNMLQMLKLIPILLKNTRSPALHWLVIIVMLYMFLSVYVSIWAWIFIF